MVAKRHSKANHPSLSSYDSSHPCKFLMFLDVNNLYGKAMMGFLPVGGFRWMTREELTVEFICGLADEGEFGCFVDCTLLYPSALHDVHDDYPLAPVKRKVSYEDLSPRAKKMCDRHRLKRTLNKEKLLTTFEMRRHYVLHYRNLKLYSSLGLIVSEVHGGLVFRQAPVMRKYVQFNLLRRSQARNDFDVDFYKLLSNSLFGKTIENLEKRTKVKVMTRILIFPIFHRTIGCMTCHINIFRVPSKMSVGGPRSFLNLWACVARCTVCSLTMVPHKHAQSQKWRKVSKVVSFGLVSLSMITFVACCKTR